MNISVGYWSMQSKNFCGYFWQLFEDSYSTKWIEKNIPYIKQEAGELHSS